MELTIKAKELRGLMIERDKQEVDGILDALNNGIADTADLEDLRVIVQCYDIYNQAWISQKVRIHQKIYK